MNPIAGTRLAKSMNLRRRLIERGIEGLLLFAAMISVFTTLAIVAILLWESIAFFEHVPIWNFLTDTQWTPLFDDAHFGIMSLLSGTLTTTLVALLVAIIGALAIARTGRTKS